MRAIDADAITYESIDSSDTGRHEHYYGTGIIAVRKEDIDAMPTIQPEPHWIPVTDPPKGDFMPYYATCRSKVDDRENWVIEGMYTKYSGWEYPPMVRDDRAEIIAWMPKELPEPFKGVTS